MLYGSYALVRPPLPDGPGTVHAEIAREMVARRDWSTAYVNGAAVPAASRPLDSRLLDRSIAASFRIFGVADWSARLPIALCVLALATIAFFFGRTLFVWNAAGLYAALLVLCWPGTFAATRDLTPAPFLCVAAGLVAFALWYLLMVRDLPVWIGAAFAAVACLAAFAVGDRRGSFLFIVFALAVWASRRERQPERRSRLLLTSWALTACFLSASFDPHTYNIFVWLQAVLPLGLALGGWLANREAFSDRAKAETGTRRLAYAVFAVGALGGAAMIVFAVEGPLGFGFLTSPVALTSGTGRIPFVILAAALLAGVTGNLVYRLQNQLRAANCFLIGMLAGVTVAFQAGFVLASPASSSQILADAIRPELQPTDAVVIDGQYLEASSFAFYLERPVTLAQPTSVDQLWTSSARVYLWTNADHPFPVPGQSYVVASSGGKEVLSNQPNSGGASF